MPSFIVFICSFLFFHRFLHVFVFNFESVFCIRLLLLNLFFVLDCFSLLLFNSFLSFLHYVVSIFLSFFVFFIFYHLIVVLSLWTKNATRKLKACVVEFEDNIVNKFVYIYMEKKKRK